MATAGAAPLEELEELSQELLRELRSGCTEELLRRGLERRERMETRLLETQSKARDIAKVHYGPDIAVPLDMDEAQHSRTFISDYLWGLVPTEWRPRRPPVLPREPTSP